MGQNYLRVVGQFGLVDGGAMWFRGDGEIWLRGLWGKIA